MLGQIFKAKRYRIVELKDMLDPRSVKDLLYEGEGEGGVDDFLMINPAKVAGKSIDVQILENKKWESARWIIVT